MPSLETVLRTYLQIDRSPVTNRNYGVCLHRMADAIGPSRDIRLVNLADLIDYVAGLRSSVSAASCAQYVRIIKTFFTWCVTTQYLENSPAAGLVTRKPTKDTERNRAIPPEDLRALLNALRDHPRDYACVMFLADTGCRIGALGSLRLSMLNLKEFTAVLREKGDRYHTVYFGEETAAALRRWLEVRPSVRHDAVFTWGKEAKPLKAFSISKMIERTTAAVCSRSYRPHSIRHAVGHAWAKLGIPVTMTAHKLGHVDPKVTLAFYYPEDESYLRDLSYRHALASLHTNNPPVERSQQDVPSKIIRLDFG